MKLLSVIVAALSIMSGVTWAITAMGQNSAKSSGCGCIECACPDCNGEVCTCTTCMCRGCGCLAAASESKHTEPTPQAKHSCCVAKKTSASACISCACESCKCPDCNGEFCTCTTCECAVCGCGSRAKSQASTPTSGATTCDLGPGTGTTQDEHTK
jgi:hypothetical protein